MRIRTDPTLDAPGEAGSTSPSLGTSPPARRPPGPLDSAASPPAQRGRRGRHASGPAASGTERHEPTVPAKKAIVLVASVLALLVLLQAPAMVHAGEGMPPGTTRDLVLGFARPIESVTSTLRLDRPAKALAGV
nr:hypothetical protein [Micromonospora sp. DSM 115978]